MSAARVQWDPVVELAELQAAWACLARQAARKEDLKEDRLDSLAHLVVRLWPHGWIREHCTGGDCCSGGEVGQALAGPTLSQTGAR